MTIYSGAVTQEQSQMIRGNKFRLTKVMSYIAAHSPTQHSTTLDNQQLSQPAVCTAQVTLTIRAPLGVDLKILFSYKIKPIFISSWSLCCVSTPKAQSAGIREVTNGCTSLVSLVSSSSCLDLERLIAALFGRKLG